MGSNQLASTIKMVNQIAVNNSHLGDESEAAIIVASHIGKFWAKTMKQQLCQYFADDGSALNPIAQQAVKLVQQTL